MIINDHQLKVFHLIRDDWVPYLIFSFELRELKAFSKMICGFAQLRLKAAPDGSFEHKTSVNPRTKFCLSSV